MASLVIVESETKARTLSAQSQGRYTTLVLKSAPMGVSHEPKAGKLCEGETGFRFFPADGEREFAEALLAAINYDIYLALESDERGEFWSWMINSYLLAASQGRKGGRRIHISGLAEQELRESFQKIEPVQNRLAANLYIRSLFNSCLTRHLARLFGTVNGPGGLALTHASLTTLFLLQEREAERSSLPVSTKWLLQAKMICKGNEVMSRLQEAYLITDDGVFENVDQLKKAVALVGDAPFTVKKTERSSFTLEPPMPCRLVDVLQDGFTRLAMGPKKVLLTLQKLYNGVILDGKSSGLITTLYPREPGVLHGALTRLREQVVLQFGEAELVERPLEEPVLLPLHPGVAGADLRDVLSEEECRLYDMVRGRALASQMREASGARVTATFQAGRCLFTSSGPQLEEEGFLAVYQEGYDSRLLADCPLSGLAEGEACEPVQLIPEQSGELPGEYYTFETLFADMADFSIAVTAPAIVMLQDMLDKGYLRLEQDGTFRCLENVDKVIGAMNRAFPAMKGIHLSAYFEQTVSEVTSNRKMLDFALKQFDQNFVMHGVPQRKVHVPRSVPIRPKKSKSIIKSPIPDAKKPVTGKPGRAENRQVIETPFAEIKTGEEARREETLPAADETSAGEGRVGEEIEAVEEEVVVPPPPADEEEKGPTGLDEETEERETDAEPAVSAEVETIDRGLAALVEEEETAGRAEPEEPVSREKEEEDAAVFAPSSPSEEERTGQGEPALPPSGSGSAPATDKPSHPEMTGRGCPDCGRALLLKNDRYGKYWVCSGYPACRHSESYDREQEALDLNCPLCRRGTVVVKRTPTGKKLYVCTDPQCEFMAWSRPHPVACPGCGSPFLVEKKLAGGVTVLRCPRAGCNYRQPLPGATGEIPAAGFQAGPKKKKVLVRRKKGGAVSGKKRKVLVRRRK